MMHPTSKNNETEQYEFRTKEQPGHDGNLSTISLFWPGIQGDRPFSDPDNEPDVPPIFISFMDPQKQKLDHLIYIYI